MNILDILLKCVKWKGHIDKSRILGDSLLAANVYALDGVSDMKSSQSDMSSDWYCCPMSSGRMNAMQFVDDLLIPSLLPYMIDIVLYRSF
ncbi:hypothetical protein TNCV_844831 [Trichonephila clavipes]|uniref:Uncharacterized protein n=1 Tax=Trichonephila clavipes TaxID=2585209 RepID=A0A8X7BKR8_TRICX|nr:hypothetical protein TNCV_844831 [Trichonephila clavipes]